MFSFFEFQFLQNVFTFFYVTIDNVVFFYVFYFSFFTSI
jgi:hypothetical protein